MEENVENNTLYFKKFTLFNIWAFTSVFYCQVIFYYMKKHILFISSSVDSHLGFFSAFLANMNIDALSSHCTHMCRHVLIFLGNICK